MTDDAKQPPLIRPISVPMDVPVFNVLIYVKHEGGKVQARVANLPDLAFSASSEPGVLKQSITEAKSRLAKWHGAGETIPWVDPVPKLEDGEQERHVPVHL